MVENSIQKSKLIQQKKLGRRVQISTDCAMGAGGDAECFCGQKIGALQWETRQHYRGHHRDATSLVLWRKGCERQPGLVVSHVQKRKGRGRIMVRWQWEQGTPVER